MPGICENEIFKMCLSDKNWMNAYSMFDEMLGRPYWWGIQHKGNRCDIMKLPSLKPWNSSALKGKPKCRRAVVKACNEAHKNHKISRLHCNSGCYGLVFPFIRGTTFYGAVAVCHLKQDPSMLAREIALLETFASSVLETAQKEYELSRLYDTIRPRAIALSTVHTVHRILSSTLNEKELTIKIVRLTTQLMSAKCSSVMLVDDTGKFLETSACMGAKPRRSRMGAGMCGCVAQTGNPYRNANMICVPIIDENVTGIITVRGRSDGKRYTAADEELMTTLAEQVSIALKNARLYEDQQKVIMGSVKSIAKLLEAAAHSCQRFSHEFVELVLALAREMRLSTDQVTSLHYAAMLHGASDISFVNGIHEKKTKLTSKEKKLVEKGPMGAASIIRPIEVLKPVIPIIVHHHEQYDGRGYPDGLKGREIPVGSMVMAVADSFLAMTSSRSYARTKTVSEAIAELCRERGVQFSPEVVDAFVKLAKEGVVEEIMSKRKSKRS